MYKNKISKMKQTLDSFNNDNKSLFLTSSFQTQSLVLLKLISNYDNSIPVYFIDTGFHFSETILYKNKLAKQLNLNVIDLFSDIPLSNQLNSNNRLLYTSDPDRCCEMNKTLPLHSIINKYDVWVTGIRRDQTKFRKHLKYIEKILNGKTKYNPLLNWTRTDVQDFISFYDLPKHPLDSKGLMSIGCEPCTRIMNNQNRKDGRWFGQTKIECGLHLNFKDS